MKKKVLIIGENQRLGSTLAEVITKSVCDNCEPVSGLYLGITCPKCNRPFRKLISNIDDSDKR